MYNFIGEKYSATHNAAVCRPCSGRSLQLYLGKRVVTYLLLFTLAAIWPGFVSASEEIDRSIGAPIIMANADADWVVFESLASVEPVPTGIKSGTKAWLEWMASQESRLREAGLQFMDQYPDDPRRWKVINLLVHTPHSFIKEVKAEYDEIRLPDEDFANQAKMREFQQKLSAAVVQDWMAMIGWEKRRTEILIECLIRTDAPEDLKAYATSRELERQIGRVSKLARSDMTAYFAARAKLRPRLDEQLARYPHAVCLKELVMRYLNGLPEMISPQAQSTLWQTFAQSPNEPVRTMALENLQRFATEKELAQLHFVAVDGRVVDVAKLRGKVVLVDFWATWCTPCKAELPNIKAVFDQYHDRNFEVIGISLDSEKDRQKLIDYCRDHGLNWPQHFDGKHGENQFAVQFGIKGIPATYLLDKQGAVVAKGLRGEELELAVRKYLGIQL